MFLNQLRPSEKLAFLQLAHQVINADGARAEVETRLLEAMGHEMNFAFDSEELNAAFEIAVARFQTPVSRRIALMELLSLSYADREFAESERALINRLAQSFGVDAAELARLEDWVRRMMDLTLEGQRLLG